MGAWTGGTGSVLGQVAGTYECYRVPLNAGNFFTDREPALSRRSQPME